VRWRERTEALHRGGSGSRRLRALSGRLIKQYKYRCILAGESTPDIGVPRILSGDVIRVGVERMTRNEDGLIDDLIRVH
jgi:hypothetical protein